MKQSLTYYITLLVIKLKGLKKTFSVDPIDFRRIRKEDIHNPKGRFFRNTNTSSFKIANTSITEVQQTETSNGLILFIHGGAFISGPAKHHWDKIEVLAKKTHRTIWMCDYPKAPEHEITEISENIDQVYHKALTQYKAQQITLIGDSVGGTLITALVQRLIQKSVELPRKIILVSPVMDATMSNPQIDIVDNNDPMLSKTGVLSAKRMCAGNIDLTDVMISPLNGSFSSFPKTVLFLAENDITYPDQELAVSKLAKAKVDFEVFTGKQMPHIWPFLPVMKEAKTALNEIVKQIND